MTELKTQRNKLDPRKFLDAVADPKKRADAHALLTLMEKATRRPPCMWGTSIVGFGSYRYTYANGRSGEWPLTGFSPRKHALTLYIMSGFDSYETLLGNLGKFKTGKSCLYVKRLEDVDVSVLGRLIRASVAHLRRKWPTQ